MPGAGKLPVKVDECVASIKAKWASNPKNKPKPKDGQDEESMAIAMCRASMKMQEDQNRILLEGVGPALVAVAVTAKPHLRQRGQEIKLVEVNGEKLVEVPLLKKGMYKHPKGSLVFNDAFMQRMVENHQKKVTDYNVHLDFRHNDSQGALAFLDPDDGGWLEVKGDWLYAYGKPTDASAEQIITSRKWRYASPEFAPDYESNFVQKLSSDDLEEITLEDLPPLEEIEAPKVIKTIQLFNPYHSAANGQFTSKSGGTGGGSAESGSKTKKVAIAAARGAVKGATAGLLLNLITGTSSTRGLGAAMVAIMTGVGAAVEGAKEYKSLEEFLLEDNLVSQARKMAKVFEDFVNSDEETIEVPADKGKQAGLDKIGFVKKGDMLSLGKDKAKKILQNLKNYLAKNTKMEVSMKILEDGTATLTAEEVVQVQALQDKVTQLESKVVELTPAQEPELPEAYRVRLESLEAENRQLARERREERVNAVIAEAKSFRDSRGYGHDKVFLELAEAALKMKDYSDGNGTTVKLENGAGKPDPVAFFSNVIMAMLKKNPGTVPMQSRTEQTDVRLEAGDEHYTQAELEQAQEDFWKN